VKSERDYNVFFSLPDTTISTGFEVTREFTLRETVVPATREFCSALPLKLLGFSVRQRAGENVLTWSTAQEINTHKFEIERSNNGNDYTNIGKIIAGLSQYSFNDVYPLAGTNYYRLKIIDRDGSHEYSPVKTIQNNSSFSVNVYPLPAKEKLNVEIQSSKTGKANVAITDVSGKTLITTSLSVIPGSNRSAVNIQSLSKGVYFLKVISSEATETIKIMVDN
ncbi:MAG TPA: T9SS type A sorting domain-containing protein, partial [Segetibacter sp.]